MMIHGKHWKGDQASCAGRTYRSLSDKAIELQERGVAEQHISFGDRSFPMVGYSYAAGYRAYR
jgi:hypothetical protein